MEQYWLSYFDSLFRLNRITEAKDLLKQAKDHGIAGQTLKKIATDTDRDFFMNSKEAKSYGIVDSILKKR